MKTGKVKWFDSKKGFGFITSEDNKDIFFHYTGLQMEGYKNVAEGDKVTYDTEKGKKGIQAINIKVIK